jgi:aconitate hydratase
MGVLPLQFLPGESVESLGLTGEEKFDILGLDDQVEPQGKIRVQADKGSGGVIEFQVIVRLDTDLDIEYYRNGGILRKVLRDMLVD